MKCTHQEFIEYQRGKEIDIDTTDKCMLQCPMCIRQTDWGKNKIKESYDITVEDTLKIAEFKDYMHFCGQISDPIYHKDFLHILDVCRNYYGTNVDSPKVQVATNGYGKTLEWWKEAFEKSQYTTCWRFGVDSITDGDYRVNQKFETIWQAMKLGAKMGLVIKWQFILLKDNIKDIEIAKKMASDNGIFFQTSQSSRLSYNYNEYRPDDKYVSFDSQNIRRIYEPEVKYYKEHYPNLHWIEDGLIDSNNMTW